MTELGTMTLTLALATEADCRSEPIERGRRPMSGLSKCSSKSVSNFITNFALMKWLAATSSVLAQQIGSDTFLLRHQATAARPIHA